MSAEFVLCWKNIGKDSLIAQSAQEEGSQQVTTVSRNMCIDPHARYQVSAQYQQTLILGVGKNHIGASQQFMLYLLFHG